MRKNRNRSSSSGNLSCADGRLSSQYESDLAVHVWTVNDKAEIERLMEAGVDAVITNYPDVAVSCRNAK